MNSRGEKLNLKNIAAVTVAVLIVAIIATVFLDFSDLLVLNPPYVLLELNLIFWTIAGLAIAFISAKSYVKDGSLSVLLLSSSIIIFGISVIISGWVSTFSGPLSVTISNPCLLVASALQLLSAVLSFRGTQETCLSNRKILLATAYLASVIFVVVNSTVILTGPYPLFFTATGPTLLRQVILGSSVLLLAVASIIFGFQYSKSKARPLFWYTLAIALLSIGLFSAFEVKAIGDVPTWLGRATLYLGTAYLLAAILASRQKSVEGSNLADSWAEAFKGDRGQIATLFSNMLDAFVYGKAIIDKNGKPIDSIILEVNDAFEQITGIKKENAIGRKASELVPGVQNDPAGWIAIYGRVAVTGEPAHFENYLAPLKKWYHVSAYSPKRGYFVSIFEDITEHKKAEDALKENEQTFIELIERAPFGIYVVNSQFRIEQMNKGSQDGAFRNVRPVIGRDFSEAMHILWPEPTASEILAHFHHTLETGEPYYSPKFINPRHDIEIVEAYEWELQRIKLPNGQFGVICYYFDSTKLRETERGLSEAQVKLKEYATNLERIIEERTKQLKDVERLAAIGATAGMVGHDIRNPLQAITSDVYLAKLDLSAMPEGEKKQNLQESLIGIENNVEYINKIVQDLQDYARPLFPAPKEIDIENVFDAVLVKKAIPKGIKVTRKVETGAEKMVCDSDLLKRILANLINNAVQAMPNGGNLSVSARREENDLVITVEDTGEGIPERAKSRLFTPLFTTKSKGQGFGLVVVKRMTEALGGTIAFESEAGKGTKFTVRLPPPKAINGK